MQIWKRSITGLLTASLLLPVPAFAIQHKVSKAVSTRQTTPTGQATATDLVNHQLQERLEFVSFANSLRAQYRSGNGLTKASVNRVIADVFKDLRRHWRLETRTKSVASSFEFPDL